MYSPKIREDLVPRLHRAAKSAGLPMTTWVNRVIEASLPEEAALHEQPPPYNRKDTDSHEHNAV